MVSRQIRINLHRQRYAALLQLLRESSLGVGKTDTEIVHQCLFYVYWLHTTRNENGLSRMEFLRRYFAGKDSSFEQELVSFNRAFADFRRKGILNAPAVSMKVRAPHEYPPDSFGAWCPCKMTHDDVRKQHKNYTARQKGGDKA